MIRVDLITRFFFKKHPSSEKKNECMCPLGYRKPDYHYRKVENGEFQLKSPDIDDN